MEKKKLLRNLAGIALLLAATVWILVRHNTTAVPYRTATGLIFGTAYNITYQSREDLQEQIEKELARFDGSLSPFNDTSVISRINRNERVLPDSLFTTVFKRSMEISRQTAGAFDITVAPLVNAWGFGFKDGVFPRPATIDSLLRYVGYQSVRLTPEGYVQKQHPQTMLDCSAVAKGYAVDIIGHLLERQGVKNFMVDIGGEVVVRGRNPQQALWRIGINKPVDDSLSTNRELQEVLHITDVGIATSGNYRNFYYRDGKKYAHTIDPHTGYPVQHELLSATVIARDCMSADAYATSFMVMGLDKAAAFVEDNPQLHAYFIYADSTGNLRTYQTKGLEQYIDSNPQ